MKENGFISIIILQIISIISILLISLLYNETSILSISNSINKNIQSDIISESNLNRLLYNKDYRKKYIYPYLKEECKDGFKKDEYSIKLEEDEFEYIRGNNIYIRFKDKEDRKYMDIQTEIIYQEVSKTIVSTGPVINNIFELGNPYINYNDLESDEITNFNLLMNGIEDEMEEYMKDFPERFDSMFIEDKSLKLSFFDSDKIIVNSYNQILNTKHLVLFNKKKVKDTVQLIIGDELDKDKKINISGILFIEGDLIINKDFNFNGILIIKNGNLIINNYTNFNLEGILIHKGNIEEFGKFNPYYNKRDIYYYGIELPGFMIPQPEIIKKY